MTKFIFVNYQVRRGQVSAFYRKLLNKNNYVQANEQSHLLHGLYYTRQKVGIIILSHIIYYYKILAEIF